ncbi:hypothetical protein HPC49_29145 [Pyxidicoccus fallax]|uniref:Uncharacterized protein n=1 Tax=Pyxidicoccus fallax TaxID=394095 RepID=A0A848LH72_9BACT|nr:hypothetical protein [Pyxidicoccus fallax]NMO16321.1 hypothetical protein [Pyxidicoccus fallax]NPC82272.1 hypothetical protein [Pyxidicoccus fallax]
MPDTLDPQSSPPHAEPPRGLGPLLLLLTTWLLPAALAGVLRAALKLPLWVGAVLGAALALAVTWKALAARRVWPTHGLLAGVQALYLAVALGVTWRMLGISVMGGLVSLGGGDAGNHVALRAEFLTHSPGIYQGFTFFHTLTHLLERLLGLDTFASFRAAFYLVPGVLAVALVVGLEAAVGRLSRSGRAAVVAQVAMLAATAFAWPFLLLRLLHYHQGEGFYAHLFGLVPLALAWLAYALPASAWARCFALAVFTVFYRYTYGLNLGDFLFTCGVLVALEGTASLGRRYRPWAWLVALALLGAAAYAYWRLLPLAHSGGGFVPHAHERALRVQSWAVAGLLVVRFLIPRGDGVERRLLDFALLFAGVNAAVQLAYFQAKLPVDYYILKYGLHALVLLLGAAMLVASARFGALLAWKAQAPRARAWSVALAVLVAVLLVEVTRGWGRSFKAYTPSYEERVRGQPPFTMNDALEDRESIALIRRVLRDSGKRFGGLLTSSWPRLNFSNAALGWQPADWAGGNGHWSVFENGAVKEGPGTCVFWEASAADWETYRRLATDFPRLEASVQRLHALPGRVCQEHPAPWVPGGTRTLCYRCD